MFRRGLIILVVVFILGAAGFIFMGKTAVLAYKGSNLIRFHVIANSDSLEDQFLKRKIRDRLMEQLGQDFAGAKSLQEARELIIASKEEIEQVAGEEIKDWGKEYPVQVVFGEFQFPTKTYGDFTLPAGKYEALRVVIGEGKGENWWCVLFPPLCFVDISKNLVKQEPATAVMQELNGEKSKQKTLEVRFKILEVFDKKATQPHQNKPLKNVI